jgi:hypothetical protein
VTNFRQIKVHHKLAGGLGDIGHIYFFGFFEGVELEEELDVAPLLGALEEVRR